MGRGVLMEVWRHCNKPAALTTLLRRVPPLAVRALLSPRRGEGVGRDRLGRSSEFSSNGSVVVLSAPRDGLEGTSYLVIMRARIGLSSK